MGFVGVYRNFLVSSSLYAAQSSYPLHCVAFFYLKEGIGGGIGLIFLFFIAKSWFVLKDK